MTRLTPTIFREYDIRGTVDTQLDPELAFLVGKSFGTHLRRRGKRRAVVGRDNRLSSRSYSEAARAGLLSVGVDVIDLGLVITPCLYYANRLYRTDGGIMVTGSHNPPDQNGFKLAWSEGTLYGSEITAIHRTIEAGDYEVGVSRVAFRDPTLPYLAMLRERLDGSPGKTGARRLKVAVDAGNGTAGLFAPEFVSALGHEVVPLYCDLDPTFPHHFPDPVVPENLVDLARVVREEGCDVGVAYDGDGDRLGVIDDRGDIVWGDRLMILFWREILGRRPGSIVLVEVKCSQVLVEEASRLGGRPVFCPTGHSLVRAKLRETGAPFAGEMSGHMFFADEYFGYDDALYATGRLLRLLVASGRRLSQLLDDVPRYWITPETRVACPDEAKFRVAAALRESFTGTHEVIAVDGARVLYPDGWGLIRASNTQPCLVVRCEARSPEGLAQIKADLAERLGRHREVEPLVW